MTVIEERDSGIGALVAGLMVAALIGFLIWLFAFSGVVFDRDTTPDNGGQITIEQEQQQQPGTTDGGTDGGTTDGGDTTTDGTGG